jgi:hypothetical protein
LRAHYWRLLSELRSNYPLFRQDNRAHGVLVAEQKMSSSESEGATEQSFE